LKTFKRMMRVAVLGAFAAGSLVAVAAPAGAHTITTTLLSCNFAKATNPLNGTISNVSAPLAGLDDDVDVMRIAAASKVATACGGLLAPATGNLVKASVSLIGVGSCPALSPTPPPGHDGYTFSGKLGWTFTNPTSSSLVHDPTGQPPASLAAWTATTKLTAYVAMSANHPAITQDDALDVVSLLGIVTKGVAVGQVVSARAVGFDPYTGGAPGTGTAMSLTDLITCTAGGSPPIDGIQSFTSGTTNVLGTAIADTVRVGTP